MGKWNFHCGFREAGSVVSFLKPLQLQEHDREPGLFKDRLFEFDIAFPPSYPFKEESSGPRSYMHTRCPAWCDRILLSKSARALVYMGSEESGKASVVYQVMGTDVCMGDHKPVALWFRLVPTAELCQRAVPEETATRYIQVKVPGSPVRIFRETTV